MSEHKRVLVLSVSSGSGHTRAAQAVAAYCNANELTYVEHVDTLQYADKLYKKAYADAYEKIVVVCGRNEKLKNKIEKLVVESSSDDVSFLVLGYTTVMHKLMAMADLFVGKPGGLTTSECLATGLPIVVFNPIPGQEERNSDFLLENRAAIKCSDLAMMSFKIDRLLQDPERLKRMQESAKKLGFPKAAECVVETLRNRYA